MSAIPLNKSLITLIFFVYAKHILLLFWGFGFFSEFLKKSITNSIFSMKKNFSVICPVRGNLILFVK